MDIQRFFDNARGDFFCHDADGAHLSEAARQYGTDAVFLAGGGEDSAAAMLHFCDNIATNRSNDLAKKPINIYPMYMDYGQLAGPVEIACIINQCEEFQKFFNGTRKYDAPVFRFHPLRVMKDPLLDDIVASESLLTGGNKSAYIEYRNIRYLTTAAAYASLKGAVWLVAGLAPAIMSIDSGYAANICTQLALNQNTLHYNKRVRLYAPIILMHRSACVQYLYENAKNTRITSNTFSCYTPSGLKMQTGGNVPLMRYTPCGTCLSCQVRIGGHRLSGYADVEYVDVPDNIFERIQKVPSK